MKPLRSTLQIFCVVLFVLTNSITWSQSSDYVSGQLFVQLKTTPKTTINWSNPSTSLPIFNKLVSKYRITRVSCPFILDNAQLQRTYLFEFDDVSKSEQLIKELSQMTEVEYAEHVPTHSFSYTPNDPMYSNQWHLQTIQAELAWDVITTQTSSIVIAIVDDAVRLDHQDLQASIWQNPGEIAGDGIDNDGNGFIDDVNGWDAADNDNNANPDNPTNSFFTHGTHCAGIAAGRTDNGIGIASLGYQAQIMPVKTSSLPNPGAVIAGYAGVQYAIVNHADVISMSWGGGSASATYQLIFDQAYSEGIVCVAAAGNSNTSAPMYPASYNHVISVGATDQNDQKASFSNYGSTIDVMAPGVAIYSSLAGSTSSYGNLQGTSMACPLVAGLAAMLLACDPNLTPDDVENCIESSADDIYPLNPNYTGQLGAGRINAAEAVACVKQLVARFESNIQFACPNQTIQFTDNSAGTPTSWAWSFPGGSPATSSLQNPTVSYPTSGNYTVQLIVNDGTNIDTLIETNYITVGIPQGVISGGGTIIAGYTGYLEFNFTGNAPWSITYTDGTTPVTINGILTTPYYVQVTPTDTTTYTLTVFSDGGCTGTFSGSATINIQPPSGSINCTYAKYYGDAESNLFHEIYYDIAEDAVYAVGSHSASGALYSKFDAVGDLIFAVSVPGISGFIDIVPAPNGDKLCLSNDNEDMVIARFSNSGQLLWINRYNAIRERSPDMIASAGDTYILTTWYSTGGSSDDAAFMRIDGAGNILWTTKFHSADDQPYEIYPDGLGGAVFSGGIHGGAVDMFVGEIDVNGNFGIIAEYNQAQNDVNEAYELMKTMNNEYLVVSKVNLTNTVPFNVNLMRLDANFDLIWEVNFTNGNGSQISSINDITEDSYGNIYLTFSYVDGTPDLGAIIKFDALGNHIWSKQLDDTRILKITNTNSTPVDNLIIGRLHDGANFGTNDCFLARTDTSLTICNALPTTTTFFNAVSTRSNLPFTASAITFTNTPINTTLVPLNYQMGTLCEDCDADTSCVDQIDAMFSYINGCLDDTTFFTDESTSLAGTVNTWAWDFGDGGISFGNPNPTHVYTVPGTYTITLTVTNDSTPICFDTYSTTITVGDAMLQMPNDTLICLGDSVLLAPVMILCASQVGWTYAWTPTIGVSNPSLQQPTVSPPVTTTYTVTATKGPQTLTGTVTISVDLNCCSSHAAFAPIMTYCEGDTILLDNVSNAGPNPVYEWNFGAAATPSSYSGTTPPAIIFSGNGVFPVTLILSDNCGIDTLTTDIVVFPHPVASAGPDKELCAPGVIEIGDSTTAWYLYEWTPAALVDDSSNAHPDATIPNDTSFIVEVTDTWTGCSTTDTVSITINQPMSGQLPNDSLCTGDQLLLDASNFGTSWLWQDGSTNSTFNVTTGGTYWVLISDACSSIQDTIEIVEYQCFCALTIPNVFSPNGDGINELFLPIATGLCSDDYEVSIFNRWGNVVWSAKDQGIVGWNGLTSDGEKVTDGTYFYLINFEGVRYDGFVNVMK